MLCPPFFFPPRENYSHPLVVLLDKNTERCWVSDWSELMLLKWISLVCIIGVVSPEQLSHHNMKGMLILPPSGPLVLGLSKILYEKLNLEKPSYHLVSLRIDKKTTSFLEIYLSTPKEWIILSQLPLSLVGGFPVWILSLFSFVADISEPKQRGFRMIMITLASSWGSPPAPFIGALIFDYGNQKVKNGNVNL